MNKHLMSNLRIITVFLIAFKISVYAQDEPSDFQTRIDYRTVYTINDIWAYDGTYGLSGFGSNDNSRRVFVNPAFVYNALKNTDMHFGLRFDYTSERDVTNTFGIRPWQGVRFVWPKIEFIVFSHYIRLEERFTWGTEDGSFDFLLRARYQIKAKTHDLKWALLNQTYYLLTSFEIFADIEEDIEKSLMDQGRFTFGIGFFITQDWRAEVHYLLQGTIYWAEKSFDVEVNTLRLKFIYFLNLMYQASDL